MNDSLLRIYHRLPHQLRFMVATCRGYQLRSLRYGPETEQLVAEATEREHWSIGRWKRWQEEKLARMLNHAATQVPYYREQWALRRRKGDRASWEYLENWPVLEKDAVRDRPAAFVADGQDLRRLVPDHTSGTTGKSLKLWFGQQAVRAWYALFEARARRWHGVSMNDRWAVLGGQLVTSVYQRKPPFWVWNAAMKQLYMSSYHLAPDLIPYYLDAIKKYNIRFIYTYPSSLYSLAQEILRLGRRDLNVDVIITNAEPLFDYQRKAISEAFKCPVRETYGMSETLLTASECKEGALHLWPEVGYSEVSNGDISAENGLSGDLICTGLLNPDMPLIRYRVGDRVTLPTINVECDCGRSLPSLSSVEGRVDDVLYTVDGRRIGRLDPVFKANLPVREAQIIQEALDRVTVRFVPTPDYTSDAGRSLIQRLQERMGAVEIVLEEVQEVPRTHNGKFRAVISQISNSL